MKDNNKQSFYMLGWIFLYVIYCFIGVTAEHYLKTPIPLLISNLILFFILMHYADKKWKEGSK